jgi:hypothetical protein
MKINFAQVPDTNVDTFGEDGLFGPDTDGNFYYNFVEFGTNPGGMDEVAIHDTCDRYMPIAVENIPDLIKALSEVYKISTNINRVERIKEFVESDKETYIVEIYGNKSVSQATSWPFSG